MNAGNRMKCKFSKIRLMYSFYSHLELIVYPDVFFEYMFHMRHW